MSRASRLDGQCQRTATQDGLTQSPVKERSNSNSGPGDFALLRLAFDVCASVDFDFEDRLIFSWSIIQITRPLNVNHYPMVWRELRTDPPKSENYAFNSCVDGRVGKNLGVLGQVYEIAQGEDESVISTEGVDECLMRGEINLDLADVFLGRNFGLGSVTSDDGNVKFARGNESVEYWLA